MNQLFEEKSCKVAISIQEGLKNLAQQEAKRNGISFSAYVKILIAQDLTKKGKMD